MPKVRITSIRRRIEHIVEDFVGSLYYHEHGAPTNPSASKIRKDMMQEMEPHIKAIHIIFEKERDNMLGEHK